MKRIGAALVVLAVSLSPAAGQDKQQLTLGTMTCKEFVDAPKETIGIILTWIIGHYHDENEPLAIDFTKMEDVGRKLAVYCGTNPAHPMAKAIDTVME